MKQKNLFLMSLAMLLMLPLGAWADSSGSLFVNDKNSYTKSNPKTFTYEGKSYTGYPMSGASNVWYVAEGTGGYSSTIKMLYMENASIKFVQGTKSIKGLIIVVKGSNKMTYTGGSCIKMEKGDLTIAGLNGASSDKLTLSSAGKYHGAFTTTGGITVKNVNLVATTNTSSAALSADDGPLKFINASASFTGTLYATTGVTLTGCSFTDSSLAWTSSNKYVSKNGTKQSNVTIKVNTTTTPTTSSQPAQKTTAQKIAELFDESKGTTSLTLPYGWKILGRSTFKCTTAKIQIEGKEYTASLLPYKNCNIYWVSQLLTLVFESKASYGNSPGIGAVDNVPFIEMPTGNHSDSWKLSLLFGSTQYDWRFNSTDKANCIRVSKGTMRIKPWMKGSSGSNVKIVCDYGNNSKKGLPTFYVSNAQLDFESINLSGYDNTTVFDGSWASLFVKNATDFRLGNIKGFDLIYTTNCGLDNSHNEYDDLALNVKTGVLTGKNAANVWIRNTDKAIPIDTKPSSSNSNYWYFKDQLANVSLQQVTLPFILNGKTQFTMKEKKTITSTDCSALAGKVGYLLYDGGKSTGVYWLPTEKCLFLGWGVSSIVSSIKNTSSQEMKLYVTSQNPHPEINFIESTGSGKVYIWGGNNKSTTLSANGDVELVSCTMGNINCKGSNRTLTMTSAKANIVTGFTNIVTTKCGIALSYQNSSTLVWNKTKGKWMNGTANASVKIDATGGGYRNTPGCVEIDTRTNTKTQNGDVVWPVSNSKKVWEAGPAIAN